MEIHITRSNEHTNTPLYSSLRGNIHEKIKKTYRNNEKETTFVWVTQSGEITNKY